MSMLLKISPEADLLNVVASGEFSLKEAERTFLQILEAVVLHKAKKVLFDGQQLLGKPKTMERFYYGEFAARSVADFWNRGVPSATQFAYVLRKPMLDPEKLGENTAVNRGMYVKTFDNLAEALQWLGIAPANQPEAGDGSCRA